MLSRQVGASADDGHAYPAVVTAMDSGGTNIYICNDYRAFFRFTNITIPQGATINSVVLQFYSNQARAQTTAKVKIHFEAADNPGAPSDHTDLTGRSLTTGTSWTVGAWSASIWYSSPEVKAELQAVVDRVGWSSGNSVMVHILNDGSTVDVLRRMASYDSSSSLAAKLDITYS